MSVGPRVLPTLMLHVGLEEAWLGKLLLVDLVEDIQEGRDDGALPVILMHAVGVTTPLGFNACYIKRHLSMRSDRACVAMTIDPVN